MGKQKKIFYSFGIAIILLGMVFFATCTFKSPNTPIWSVQFVVPVVDKTYTMGDLSDETSNIDTLNGEVLFKIDKKIKTFEVGDFLNVEGIANRVIPIPFGSINDFVELPLDSVAVDSAEIKTGEATLRIDNPYNYQVHIKFQMDDLLDPDGAPYTIESDIPEYGSRTFSNSLENYIFKPVVVGGRNRIRYSGSLTRPQGSGSPNDQVNLTLDISKLVFSSVTGVLTNVTVSIDSEETDVDIPEEFEGFQIGSAELKLALNMGVLFPLRLNLSVQALECRGNLPSPIVIDTLITPTGTTSDTIYIPDVAAFINSLPTKILVSGSVEIGDGVTHATISDTNTVNGKAIFQAPLTFSFPSRTNESDVENIEQDEDARKTIKDIRKRFVSGEMVATVINHLPLGVDSVLICFAKDSASVFNNPDLKIGLSMKSGTVSGTPGVVIEPATSENEMMVTNEDLKLFEENEVVYYGTKFEFPGTQGMVKVCPSDYIRIQAVIKAKVRADFSSDDEDEEGGGS